jgi:hypothetical protein
MVDRKAKMSKILGVSFLAILFGMLLLGILLPDQDTSDEENRSLQTLPSFNLTEYFDGRFETKVENYVNDQFPGRSEFISLKAAADKTLGVLESNGVYRASNNYLMEELTTPDEENLTETEEAIADFASRHQKLKMYFLLTPNAGNILSEYLPATVQMADQNGQMDAFFDRMQQAGIKTIDVREAFNKNKADIDLYYHTDHHWTSDGAYLAYQTAIGTLTGDTATEYVPKVVKTDFRGTLASKSGFVNGVDDTIKIYLPVKESRYKKSVIYYTDTQKKTTNYYQLKKLDTKDAYAVFGGSNHPMYTIETPVANKRRLLLVKDSYANSMIPFLTQHYREIVVVDPRYYFDSLEDLIQSEKITDVLFLYNANTFFADDSLKIMLADTE